MSAGPDGEPTSPADEPAYKIDWVFGQGITFDEATVLTQPQQSDHLPLVARFTVGD